MGFQDPQAFLQAQAALVPRAYASHCTLSPLRVSDCAEKLSSSLLCCTWGHEGASALELPSFAYEHSPAYVEAELRVIECVFSI